MNISEAKNIRIVSYLASLGYRPVRVCGDQHWYLSPLRDEHTASFKVNDRRNGWYDFGIAEGGDIITLGKRLYQTDDVAVVLERLSQHAGVSSCLRIPPSKLPPKSIENEMRIRIIQPLQHRALLSYLASRGINEHVGRQYCREIYYDVRKHEYFALAFKNDSGGYEIRNQYFKGCIFNKDITLIRHVYGKNQQHVCVMEGFMDFLSYLTLQVGEDKQVCIDSPTDFLVMNSVSNLKKTWQVVENYPHIHCYLDNDTAGDAATDTIVGLYEDRVTDESYRYIRYKDLNDYLIGRNR